MTQNRILLIERESHLKTILRSALIKIGFEVDDHNDATSGLQQAKIVQYSLIVVTLHAGLLGGISFTRAIRSSDYPLNSKTPVRLLSSDASKETLTAAIQAGVNDILLKPFTLSDLSKKVSRYLVK